MTRRRAEQRHPTKTRRDTVVGYCRPDNVDGCFSECLAALMEHDMLGSQRILKRVYIESGPRIASARNRIVAQMLLDPGAQWLAMLDVDMTFPPDWLDQMLGVANPIQVPILGALCFAGGRDFRIVPTIYAANPDAEPGELNFQVKLDYPRDALVKCHATGAAAILIHRSVLASMNSEYRDRTVHPWFAETEIPPVTINGVRHPGGDVGEDITFCMRANKLGFPVHVHTGIKVGHRKKVTLDEDAYLANRALILEHGEDEVRARALTKIGVAS